MSHSSSGHASFCRNPVFIIGSERSGTNILALALGLHSDLWYSCEGHLFPSLFEPNILDRVYSRGQFRNRWLYEQNVSKEEFLECLGLGINVLFSSRSGGRRWIDKTPRNTLLVTVLVDMFPTASFIHILRDGRSVVNSMINFLNDIDDTTRADRTLGGAAPRFTLNFTTACRDWVGYVSAARTLVTEHPDRCLTVAHEQLSAAPGEEFAKIFRFLDVPDQVASAEYFRSTSINSSFGPDFAAPDFHTRPDPWDEWTVEQKRIFLDEAGDAMLQWHQLTADELRLMEVEMRAP